MTDDSAAGNKSSTGSEVETETDYLIEASFDDVKQAMGEERFVTLMQSLRMMNSLTFMLGSVIDANPWSTHSRYALSNNSGQLLLGSVLHEAVKYARQARKKYKHHPAVGELKAVLSHAVCKKLQDELGYLARVRNKVAFHSDPEVVSDIRVLEYLGVTFVRRTGTSKLDSHYDFVDSLALLFPVLKPTKDGGYLDDLPDDNELAEFFDRFKPLSVSLTPTDGESPHHERMKRLGTAQLYLSYALIRIVQEFSRTIFLEIGATERTKPYQPPTVVLRNGARYA